MQDEDNMYQIKPVRTTTLTLETDDDGFIDSVTVYRDHDPSIDEWIEIFKAMLFCLGFHPKTIAEVFPDCDACERFHSEED